MPRPVALWRAHADDLAFDDAFMQEYARAEIDPLYVRERDWIVEGVIPLPPELPAFDELRVSPDGHLWARRFTPPWQTGERWGVFAPDGVFLGNIAMPENFRVTDVGPDHVLGIATDSLDVERVYLYRINR